MSKIKQEKLEKISKEYRQDMEVCLKKTMFIIKEETLSYKDIEDNLRENPAKLLSCQCANLLTKAHIHLIAAQEANARSNLHSLAVHMRVVLECAGLIMQIVESINKKDINFYSIQFADYKTVMSRMTKNVIRTEDKKAYLASLKNSMKDYVSFASKENIKIKKIVWHYSKTVKHLEFGKNWYDHISKHFVHSDIESLKSISHTGGVLSNNALDDIYMFAFFLDYLTHQTLVMAMYVEAYVEELASEDYRFNKLVELMERKKERSNFYKNKIAKYDVE